MKEKSLIDRLLSLSTSVMLFLFSLRYIVCFFYFEENTFWFAILCFSGFLYLLSSILLMLDFFNVNLKCVKGKFWLPLFLAGFIPKCLILFLVPAFQLAPFFFEELKLFG